LLSEGDVLHSGKIDVKIRLATELSMLKPTNNLVILVWPILSWLVFQDVVCFVIILFPFAFILAGSTYYDYRKPEEQKLAESREREQFIKRIKSEIEKLEKPDPEWSRYDLTRLRSLQMESAKFRKSTGDYRFQL
jgi:hypothetical protein